MKKRIFALFLSALLLSTVLCACGDGKTEEEASGFGSDGTSSSGEPVTGGELVVGISQDLGDSLDPYQMVAAGTKEVLLTCMRVLSSPIPAATMCPLLLPTMMCRKMA